MSTEEIIDDEYVVYEHGHTHHYYHSRAYRAESVVRNSMMWTGASGIIPIPIVDVAAISAFQLNMLYKISEIYDVRFSRNWGKSVIGALVGGYTATAVGTSLAKTFLRSIPVVGGFASIILVPGFAAATTYALGQVFIMHYESGGTLLDFDVDKFRHRFMRIADARREEEYEEEHRAHRAHRGHTEHREHAERTHTHAKAAEHKEVKK